MKFNGILPRSVFILVLLYFFSPMPVRLSYGDVYRYTNREGVACYTDSLYSIPEEFRKKAVRIDDFEERKARPGEGRAAGEKTEDVPDATGSGDIIAEFFRNITGNRLYRAGIALAVAIIAFIVVKKTGESVGAKKFSILLRIAVTVALLVYLYDLFSREMVSTYEGIRETAGSVREMKERRDRKLDETVKELFPEQKKEQ